MIPMNEFTSCTTDEVRSLISHLKLIIPSARDYPRMTTSTRGYQTYGPHGLMIRNNVLMIWRKIFINNVNCIEIDCPIPTAPEILQNSGHVGKFNDMVAMYTDLDPTIGVVSQRADHLVEEFCSLNPGYLSPGGKSPSTLTQQELLDCIVSNNLMHTTQPVTVIPRNLMFRLSDGMWMRPELAQSIFAEFPQFYDYFERRLPFGIAQTGRSYRNEISPVPFTRLKEFTQAEVEWFFDPSDSQHPEYMKYVDYMIPLLSESDQQAGGITVKVQVRDAVDRGIIGNQIIAVMLCRIMDMLRELGFGDVTISQSIRFRQHCVGEMAHYAVQCWDLEILIDNGWLECVGCAYRGDYDLTVHGIPAIEKDRKKIIKYRMNLNLVEVKQRYDENEAKTLIGKFYRQMKGISHDEKLLGDVTLDDGTVIPEDLIQYSELVEYQSNYFVPHVIEPSIGIDRMVYAMLCHCMQRRAEAETRVVLRVPDSVAPHRLAVFVLSNNPRLLEWYERAVEPLIRNDKHKIFFDFSSTAIGKRYVRSDQLGVPWVATIDFESMESNTVTIRSRDTAVQQRVDVNVLSQYI
jgi:glycyl-tRNA synthetase